MSKSFPEWWKHGQKVRTANDGVLTLNIAEDSEYWLTNNAGKEVSVFSMDILGPASVPEACSMTTDITELAQSLKAAAEKAIGANERLSVYKNDEIIDISQHEGEQIDIDIADINLFLGEANPANILTLVEALEKAQQVDEELCNLLPPGVEYMDPPDGGDVTPLEGVRRMVADYRQRIAELESRTVKLPKKNIGWDRDEEDCWNNAIDACAEVLAAAGIKVEAE
ncbi:TPA: hypothetical protein MIG94_01195 [Klebsiella pneumoniae]|nr:hypothetical protein [Klebsiella pneumoniae]